jgi:uncharacterized protein YjlB
MELSTYLLPESGNMPNNDRLALLVYASAVACDRPDPAVLFEQAFDAHSWPSAWRNGIFPYHHYHSTAHEALGVYRGTVSVRFGGEDGVIVAASAGDVIIVPAGVAHKCVGHSADLGIVGAYPRGQIPDTCDGSNYTEDRRTIAGLGIPQMDPVFGDSGPMLDHWRA